MKLGYSVENVRKHNLKVIAELLFTESASCNEIATQIGISETAVKKNIVQLLGCGFVVNEEEENAPRSRGGQHIRYKINGDNGSFLFVSFSNDGDWFALTDFAFEKEYHEKLQLPTNLMLTDIKGVIEKIKVSIKQKGYKPLRGIAIAISGQVDRETGDFIFSSRFDLSDFNSLVGIFSQVFHVPIFIRNDAQYDVLGELQHEDFSENNTVLYVKVGRGASGAIVNNGKFITGVRGIAGELGVARTIDGRTIHDHCAVLELVQKCAPYLKENTPEALFESYKTDERVREIVLHSAEILAQAIDSFTKILGIDKIILMGDIEKFGEAYVERMRAFFAENKIGFDRFVQFAHGENVRVIGMKKELRDKAIAEVAL